VYVLANWRVPCEEPHLVPVLHLVGCVLLSGSPCTVALAAFLRFLIMSSFLLRVDAVRMCMYHHCVSVSARLPFSSALFFSVHRACLSLRRSPFCRFCCSPVFHAPVTPPPSKQTTAFGCARQISALPPLRRFVVAPRVFSTTGLSELLAALGSSA
jgi:hypothetical protein